MNPIALALSYGYSADKVLSYISNAFPAIAPQIKQAVKYGYTPTKIVGFLTELFGGGEQIKGGTEAAQEVLSGEQVKDKAKSLAGLGLSALGGYAAGKALPSIAQGLSGALGGGQSGPPPGSPTPAAGPGPAPIPTTPSPQPAIGPQPMANAPVHTNPIAPVGPTPPGTAPPAAITQNAAMAQPAIKPWSNVSPNQSIQLIKDLGLEQRINALRQAGNSPDTISKVISNFIAPEQKKYILDKMKSGEAKPLQEAVMDYLSSNQGNENVQKAQVAPQGPEMLEPQGEKLDEAKQETEVERPKKGQTVIDVKSGISGQLKDMKEKQALIDEDGKLHKVEAKNVETVPLSEKDLGDLLDDLHNEIEKETGEEVSRAVRLAAYDPDKNILLYIPQGGSPYLYDDISPDDAEYLKSTLQLRRTTGENFIGAWKEGTKSIMGSKMHDLIKKLQAERGGKGNEYSVKFQTIYDPHGIAIKAKKEKDRQKRKKK